LEEAKCHCFQERCKKSKFQRFHGRHYLSKLEWCLHCLWDWRSHRVVDWQGTYLFFPLDSFTKQQHEAIHCYEIPRSTHNFLLWLEGVDSIMLQSTLGGIHLGLIPMV
jgi:hypothetical protein